MKQFSILRKAAAGLVYRLTNGRVITRTAAAVLRDRRRAWTERAAAIQAALDDERARGWGFRYFDGRRVDW